MSWFLGAFRSLGEADESSGSQDGVRQRLYALAASYLALVFCVSAMHHLLLHGGWVMGIKMAAAVSSLIYRKVPIQYLKNWN